MIRSFKPGCAPANPAALFYAQQLVVDKALAQPQFAVVNCSDFKAQPDIFAVMTCCVVALSLFSSDSLTRSADCLCSVQ